MDTETIQAARTCPKCNQPTELQSATVTTQSTVGLVVSPMPADSLQCGGCGNVWNVEDLSGDRFTFLANQLKDQANVR